MAVTENDLDFVVNSVKHEQDADDDPFSRQKILKGWDQDKVKNAKILVVGAGALGNEVLKNLALLGVGEIMIVDFDFISKSNLSRTVLFRLEDNGKDKAKIASERTKELCVEQTAKVYYLSVNIVEDLGDGIFDKFDVAVGCIDNLEARRAISRGCWLAGTPWVDGSISGYHGNVVIFKPLETFCFICTMSESDEKSIKKKYSCEQKKYRAFAERKIPNIQTLSSIIAGIQVQEALKIIHGDYSMVGKRIDYDGSANALMTSISKPLDSHDRRPHHGTYVGCEIEKLHWASADIVLRDFLFQLGVLANEFEISLSTRPRHDLILTGKCKRCSNEFEIYTPVFRIFADQYNKCAACGAEQPPNIEDPNLLTITFDKIIHSSLSSKSVNEKILDMTLREIGFAPLDIIELKDGNKTRYLELEFDFNKIFSNKETQNG